MAIPNVANEKQVKRAALDERMAERQRREDLRVVLETGAGQRLLWGYLEYCGVYRDSFTGNSVTYHNEGKRKVGLHILGDFVHANPAALARLMHENMKPEEVDGN